jgi:hypothetical protein
MSELTIVTRLEEAGLIPGATEIERQALADLSEREFEVLKSIKAQIEAAIGEDRVHRPEDGGLFW